MNKRRMPAEWERQTAVILSFPRREGDWGNLVNKITHQHLELISKIAEFTPVILLVADPELLQESLRKANLDWQSSSTYPLIQGDINSNNITVTGEHWYLFRLSKRLHPILCIPEPMNDVWARDFGPITIFENEQLTLLDFTFNGWGGKYSAELDNLATRALHQRGAFGNVPLATLALVLEGGSIESNGAGTIMTTSKCLLHPGRNPHLSKSEITSKLKSYLGAEQVLYLENGHLIGDDTDAHIDTLARFIKPDTIAYQSCDDVQDVHYAGFKRMEAELRTFRQLDGKPYNLIPLPWHPPVFSEEDGRRLPASYANFLITNKGVLVPGASPGTDIIAAAVLKKALPNHKINICPAAYFLEQHGSIHCLTMPLFSPS